MEYLWSQSSWDVPLFHAHHVLNLLQRLLFATLSMVANAGILHFHWTTPPHPKFTVLRKSRIIIRTHLISGTINVCLPIVAFCSANPKVSTPIMWITVGFDVIHLMTVIAQTPNVNGQRLLTVPAYQFIALVKVVSVAGLIHALLDDSLYELERLEWLWTVWANHQTYAWVRVWMVLLYFCQAARESRYTLAVLIAGTIGAGQAYGFSVTIFLIVWLIGFNLWLRRKTYTLAARFAESKHTGDEQRELNLEMSAMLQYFHEAHHGLYHDVRYKHQPEVVQKILFETGYLKVVQDARGVDTSQLAPLRTIPDDVQARCVFESVDFDNSGSLDLLELAQIFITNGVSTETTQKMCEEAFGKFDINNDGLIDLNEFTMAFKPYWAYQFAEVYVILGDAPQLMKNVINVPLHSTAMGCPFGAAHSIPLDFGSEVISWTDLVQSKNGKSLDRALSRVRSKLKPAVR